VTEPQTPRTVVYTEHTSLLSAFTRCEAICRCRCSSPMAMSASTPTVGGSGTQPALFRTRRRLVTCGVARH